MFHNLQIFYVNNMVFFLIYVQYNDSLSIVTL